MKTHDFLKFLKDNPEAGLRFEYEQDKFVPDTYHITEVKNVTIDSVDCGGRPDSYKQTIVQLWVPKNEELRKPWTAQKALSIFKTVDEMTPINQETEIFFEYGNEDMRTSHFSIEQLDLNDNQITAQLFVKPTLCKPRMNGVTNCC